MAVLVHKSFPSFRARPPGTSARLSLLLLAFLLMVSGCATRHSAFPGAHRFDFQRDTFAYPNELVWDYHFDDQGQWVSKKRVPAPDYTLHCFVMARSAKQFFQNALFAPELPTVTKKEYRKLVRRVVSSNPRKALPNDQRIVIPGYADLRSFSQAHERLLKEECGSGWQSYFQRGHWRMIFPFTRHHQQTAARKMLERVKQRSIVVAHLVSFPSLTINHAVVVFDAVESPREIVFSVYDPNNSDQPASLRYEKNSRTFFFPQNQYFPGGPLNLYEVYHDWRY